MTATAQPVAMRATGQPAPGVNSSQPGGATAPAPGYNPLQPTYVGAPPTAQATYSGANVSPQATIQQILAGFMPQARQSTSDLNSTLAAAGIVGGGAQGAQQLLQGQLASNLAPTLGNAIQTSEGMGLQQSLANAAAANQMTGLNTQDIMQSNLFNAGAANSSGSQLASMIQQGWQVPFEAQAGLNQAGVSGASGLAGQEANNFAVPQQQPQWWQYLLQGAQAAAPYVGG